ncbi:MAG: hypothetical protein Q8M16_09755 [Pirellulaceae bacterium]|nr:hypothetical protein [Pirellulaceae bacterium]
MLFGLLFRKEFLLLAGITAAFTVPMFRSGELSVGKLLHWAAEGIAPAEQPKQAPDPNFGVWTPGLPPSASSSLVPVSTDSKNGLMKFLESIFEVQTISESQKTDSAIAQQSVTSAARSTPTGPIGIPTVAPFSNNAANASPSTSPPAPSSNEFRPIWIPVNDLREVIRFDVSPYWVQQRWQPASQLDLDQDGYYGFRVPLMTDHRVGQLNGALTFYFDADAVVQRIQFQGFAAEIAPLQNLLTQYFRFEAVPDRQMLMAPIHQNVARGMFRYTEPVVEIPGQANRVREVAFEVNSTQGKYQLSEAYRQLAVQ